MPNTHVFSCELVVVTIGLDPLDVHSFLLTITSCMNMDSSCTAIVVVVVVDPCLVSCECERDGSVSSTLF